jgi:FkbM family methyltransferase
LQDNKKNNEKLSKLETAFNDVRIQLMESELKRAYNLYLHREPNVEEIHNHLNAVLANQTTIDEIMNGITQSEELKYLEKLRSGYVIMKEGFALFLDAEDQVISKAICMTGVWEPKETELVKKIIKRGMYLVDVGANIGYYTTLFSRLTGDKGKVISFEPSPLSFSILDKNARMNCLKNVVIVQKALSNLTGIEKLYLSKTNPGDNRLSSSIVEETDKDRDIIEVEVVRLDDFYKEDRIDLLKIDVQGAEMKVIEGGLKTIENNPDMQIIIEFWPKGLLAQGVEPIQLLSKLEHLGFNLYDLNTDGVLQCYNSNELYQKYVDSSVNLYCTKKSIENLKLG